MTPRGLVIVLSLLSWILYISAVAALPQGPLPAGVLPSSTLMTFYVYPTIDEMDTPMTEDIDGILLSQPLTIVFHGFKGDHTAKSMESIRQALLLNGVQNVVVVDWAPLADTHNKSALTSYHHVRDHGVPQAAEVVVDWLQYVMDHKKIVPDQVHLIGFSLGAHLVGMIGHMFNSSIGKITGLDPPKFGYEHMAQEHRLDASDAQFVNVIHTSAGILSYKEPIGHVDFFPNGDIVPQHGCPVESPIHIITCSHYFAFTVFSETIFNKNAFMATECNSWETFTKGECDARPKVAMGYYTPNTTRGTFYANTTEKVPFGDEDPGNPLPDVIVKLLTYDKSDSIVNPADVVNFLMHKEPTEPADVDNILSAEAQLDGDTKVMKVKNGRHATTTEDPPAFLNSGGSSFLKAAEVIALVITGVNAASFLYDAFAS